MLIQEHWFKDLTLDELADKLTHREVKVRLLWLQKRLNYPDRADYYSMSIAQEVRRSYAANPRNVKMLDLYLDFENNQNAAQSQQKKESSKSVHTKESIERTKKRWINRLGGKVTVQERLPDGSIRRIGEIDSKNSG